MKMNILLSKRNNCLLRKLHYDEIGRATSIMHETSSFLLSSLLSMLPAKSFTMQFINPINLPHTLLRAQE